MFCSNCGNKLEPNSKFCNECGTKVENEVITTNVPNTVNNVNTDKKNILPFILIGIMSFMVIVFIVLLIIPFGDKEKRVLSNGGSRTIMLYVVGSNLETDHGIVSADLDSIKPEEIDLENNHILIYTGGTEEWHNFISNEENAIYELKSTGFEKVKSYSKDNMGSPKTFKEFLDYSYDNYKADNYDLILYDHGGAVDGAIYDDFTKDNLSLDDFSEALDKSKFSSSNKLELVLFRTCLNGTLEVANIFKDYANYMIASEEITNGASESSVLNFLNDIEVSDNSIEFSKKYIDAYDEQMKVIDPIGFSTNPMYSVIDLSKIDNVTKELNNFFGDVDINKTYSDVVRLRGELFQYAYVYANDGNYDTVDLYTMIEKIGKIIGKDSSKLLDAISDTIVYNWSNQEDSHGLSIYFPYRGNKKVQDYFLTRYSNYKVSDNYTKYIKQFSNYANSNKVSSFAKKDFEETTGTVNTSKNEFSIDLTDEQAKDYAESIYIVFQKLDDGKFNYIYSSDNTKVNGKKLTTNISDNLIMLTDDDKPEYISVVERNNNGKKVYLSSVIMENFGGEIKDWKMDNGYAYFNFDKNGVPYISSIVESNKKDDSLGTSGRLMKLEDYTTIVFSASHFKILDDNNKYTENWDSQGVFQGYELKIKDLKFSKASLRDGGDYYCVFKVFDIYGNSYYSNLVSLK